MTGMSYTDRLMSTGERVLLKDRQHWFVVLANGRWAVLAIVAAIVLLILQGALALDGPAANLAGILTAVLFIAGLLLLGWEAIRYANQEYIITNRRVIQLEGVINKHSGDSSLEKINDADLHQSVWGRMFNFGDLDVLTASEAGIDRLRMLHDPVGFKRAMLDAKHEYEMDMSGRPVASSPPIRATPDRDPTTSVPVGAAAAGAASSSAGPSTAPTGAAQAAAATAPRAHMTADEVTRAIAGLADLRDRGAISPEEYEEKKADLLARL